MLIITRRGCYTRIVFFLSYNVSIFLFISTLKHVTTIIKHDSISILLFELDMLIAIVYMQGLPKLFQQGRILRKKYKFILLAGG